MAIAHGRSTWSLDAMISYGADGRDADFEVRYRFLTAAEGGRTMPPLQHTRWDWLYSGDDAPVDGAWMIHPEFVDSTGDPLPDGPVPLQGTARMYILDAKLRPMHSRRIREGVRGFMIEGPKRVAECEVTRVIRLSAPGI
jgi:hypothetical protein